MAFLKIKMDLSFPTFPIIYMWITFAFDKCETEFDYMNFVQDCLEESKTTANEVKKKAYENTAHVVFSKLTGKSLESYNLTIEECLKR